MLTPVAEAALAAAHTEIVDDLVRLFDQALAGTDSRARDRVAVRKVMNETLDRSSLGAIAAGSSVNLELALRASDRLGGHIVQGHVDGLGTVARVREDGFARIITIAAPPELLRYVVHKGSIAVDGVSLTVARSTTAALTCR